MQFEVREATYGDYLWWHSSIDVPALTLDIDGKPALFACLASDARDPDTLWAFLDVRAEVPPGPALTFVRQMRSSLRAAPTEVYTICDSADFPTAERLCRLLGFKPTGESFEKREIWRWG